MEISKKEGERKQALTAMRKAALAAKVQGDLLGYMQQLVNSGLSPNEALQRIIDENAETKNVKRKRGLVKIVVGGGDPPPKSRRRVVVV